MTRRVHSSKLDRALIPNLGFSIVGINDIGRIFFVDKRQEYLHQFEEKKQ